MCPAKRCAGIVVQSAAARRPSQQTQTPAADGSAPQSTDAAEDRAPSQPDPPDGDAGEAAVANGKQHADSAAQQPPATAENEVTPAKSASVWECLECGTSMPASGPDNSGCEQQARSAVSALCVRSGLRYSTDWLAQSLLVLLQRRHKPFSSGLPHGEHLCHRARTVPHVTSHVDAWPLAVVHMRSASATVGAHCTAAVGGGNSPCPREGTRAIHHHNPPCQIASVLPQLTALPPHTCLPSLCTSAFPREAHQRRLQRMYNRCVGTRF